MIRHLYSLAIACALIAPAQLRAEETLTQKQGWDTYSKAISAKATAVNAKCGSSFSAEFDKSTYANFDPIQDRTQAACLAAIDTLSAICANDIGKEAARKITKASCKFSTSGTNVSRTGGDLIIHVDPVKSSITGKKPGNYSWKSALEEVL